MEEPPAELASSEFSSLYAENSRAIYYLALRFLGDPQKAEDATHDVFLKAFRKLDQFRGEASLRTWLYRIAINHCQNLRQGWHDRHVFSNADDAVWENAAARTDSPLRVLEIKELGQRIQKTLDGLSGRIPAAVAARGRRGIELRAGGRAGRAIPRRGARETASRPQNFCRSF